MKTLFEAKILETVVEILNKKHGNYNYSEEEIIKAYLRIYRKINWG